jgi:preprotein translocase subunit SecF
MSPENKPVSPTAGSEERSPEQIRSEIDETREEMGETVAAVAAKTDVKAQAQAKVDDVKDQAKAKADDAKAKAKELGDKAKAAAPESPQEGIAQAQELAKQNPLAIAGAVLGLFVLWRLLKS